jgi:hypothetical protein
MAVRPFDFASQLRELAEVTHSFLKIEPKRQKLLVRLTRAMAGDG